MSSTSNRSTPNIESATPSGDFLVYVRFEDGIAGHVDLSFLREFGGIFAPLRSPVYFRRLRADAEAGTIVWPNDANIAPETLYAYAREAAAAARQTESAKVSDVEPLEGYWIRVTFFDGAVKDVDLSEVISKGGVFAPMRDHREVFEQVRVNPESRTVEWPGNVDLDPDVLYGPFQPASGSRIRRRTVREPGPTR